MTNSLVVPCLLSLLLVPFALGTTPIYRIDNIRQTYQLALYMKKEALALLQSYLQHQGTFSDPGFSAPNRQLNNLPSADISFKLWRDLGHGERLVQAREAFSALPQYLQLVRDDQVKLNPDKSDLLSKMATLKLSNEVLMDNLASVMSALGIAIPPEVNVLGSASLGVSAFEKKLRGYVVLREYNAWMKRIVQDIALLKEKYSL